MVIMVMVIMYMSVNYNEFSGQERVNLFLAHIHTYIHTHNTLTHTPLPLLTFPVSFFLTKKLFGGPILGVARRERLQPESNLSNKLVTIPG